MFKSMPKYRKYESLFETNSDYSKGRFSKEYLNAEITKACLRLTLFIKLGLCTESTKGQLRLCVPKRLVFRVRLTTHYEGDMFQKERVTEAF